MVVVGRLGLDLKRIIGKLMAEILALAVAQKIHTLIA